MKETPDLLPLGSAITIEDDDSIYVIFARGFQKTAEGYLAGYKAVVHPYGAAAGAKEVVIRQTQVTAVVHRGYENPDDVVFAKKQLENATMPVAKQAVAEEPDLTVDLSAPAATASAVPQPKPQEGSPENAVKDPKDPFRELRIKGKRR